MEDWGAVLGGLGNAMADTEALRSAPATRVSGNGAPGHDRLLDRHRREPRRRRPEAERLPDLRDAVATWRCTRPSRCRRRRAARGTLRAALR